MTDLDASTPQLMVAKKWIDAYSSLDASTPQLMVAKKWIDAYSSLDASKLDPLLSKHYKHQTFPKSIHAEETKEEHIKRYGGVVSSITKLDVRIQHLRTTFELAN
jgi:hypothetical protein